MQKKENIVDREVICVRSPEHVRGSGRGCFRTFESGELASPKPARTLETHLAELNDQ